jgi:hypothetical protein
MAAPCGAPPRNLSRFKLTHAELAGGPARPCRAAGSSPRGYDGDNIAVHPDALCLPFGERSARPFLLFVNDRACKEASDRRHAGFDKSLPQSASRDTRIMGHHGKSPSPLSPSPSSPSKRITLLSLYGNEKRRFCLAPLDSRLKMNRGTTREQARNPL